MNEKKSLFDYGSSDIGNISQPIQIDHINRSKFNMSASEMRCLFHYITLIIGEKVPRVDVVWIFLINLVTIIDFITQTFCTEEDVIKLTKLIKSHHTFYMLHFSKTN